MRFVFDPSAMAAADKNALPLTVLIGRFQPFHTGHARLLEECKQNKENIIIACVHSGISKRNPFSRDTISDLMIPTGVPIFFYEVGYLPLIISDLRRAGGEVHKVMCGPDRLDTYTKQLARENAKIAADRKIVARIVAPDKRFFHVSGTIARKHLEEGAAEKFRECLPDYCNYDYEQMRAELLASK